MSRSRKASPSAGVSALCKFVAPLGYLLFCLYLFGTLHHQGARTVALRLVDLAAVAALVLFIGEAYISRVRARLRNFQALLVLLLGMSGALFAGGGFLADTIGATGRFIGMKPQTLWLVASPVLGTLLTAWAWPRLSLVAKDVLSRALLIVMPFGPILARWLGAWRVEGLPR